VDFMLSVVMLNVVILNVMAPLKLHLNNLSKLEYLSVRQFQHLRSEAKLKHAQHLDINLRKTR
jgi:hypothetical protein